MENKKIKIGIVGLGLIGSSLLKALSKKSEYELFCVSNSSFEKALDFTKNASSDIEIVKNCDIVFVCCEASKTLETLDKLNNILDKNTVVADVCSIKKELLNKDFNFDFILSHPMAGTEKSGFDAGFGELFENNLWLIEKENDILNKIILSVGAKKLLIDMKDHDFMCAQISHLPALLSYALFDSAQDKSKQIASSGFRDTTRLAMTNENLLNSMYELNQENIEKALDLMLEKLNNLKKLSLDEKIELFKGTALKRKQMYDDLGKNIFKI